MRKKNIKKGTVAYVDRHVHFTPIETAKLIANTDSGTGYVIVNAYIDNTCRRYSDGSIRKPNFSQDLGLLDGGVMSVCVAKGYYSTVWMVTDPKHQRFGETFVIDRNRDNHRKIFLDPPCIC